MEAARNLPEGGEGFSYRQLSLVDVEESRELLRHDQVYVPGLTLADRYRDFSTLWITCEFGIEPEDMAEWGGRLARGGKAKIIDGGPCVEMGRDEFLNFCRDPRTAAVCTAYDNAPAGNREGRFHSWIKLWRHEREGRAGAMAKTWGGTQESG